MKSTYRTAPELPAHLPWLFSEAQSLKQHRGTPVVLFFWSRGCVACLELLASAQRWLDRYQQQGLRVLSVHAPEYAFEQDVWALEGSLLDAGYTIPVAIDGQHEAMASYQNHWRPRLFVISARGEIVRDETEHIPYGDVEETVRHVLRQAGAKGVSGPHADASSARQHARTLLGYRGGSIANRREVARGVTHVYRTPGRGSNPQLIGAWRVEEDHVLSSGGQIVLPYAGSEVYVTMDLRAAERPAHVSSQRGYFSRAEAGNDVDFSQDLSVLTPDGARPYHVVSHPNAQEGRLRLDVPEGARIYNYTVVE